MSNDASSFHIKSPLILSHDLSLLNSDTDFKCNVYLKLDNVQPSGSFKIRGIGNLVYQNYIHKSIKHLICSSGGRLYIL